MSKPKVKVEDGYSHGYVRCGCGSRRVQLYSIVSAPLYRKGRVIREPRPIGVYCRCLDCKVTGQYVVKREPVIRHQEARP